MKCFGRVCAKAFAVHDAAGFMMLLILLRTFTHKTQSLLINFFTTQNTLNLFMSERSDAIV
jgi:hypothetical protein